MQNIAGKKLSKNKDYLSENDIWFEDNRLLVL